MERPKRQPKPTEKMLQYKKELANKQQTKPDSIAHGSSVSKIKETATSEPELLGASAWDTHEIYPKSFSQKSCEIPKTSVHELFCTDDGSNTKLTAQEEEEECALLQFNRAYTTWKEGMQNMRARMRNELSEENLIEVIDIVENLHKNVAKAYDDLLTTNQPARRKIDSCTANSNNMITLVQARMSEADIQPWDNHNERARLRMVLDTEYAVSVYEKSECSSSKSISVKSQESVSSNRADAVAKLAARKAELQTLQEDEERAALKKRLKCLDTEKEIKIIQAQIQAYDFELGHSPVNQSNIPVNQLIQNQHNVKTHDDQSAGSETNIQQSLNNNFSALSQAIQQTFDYNQIPNREPSTFSGDPLKFIKWKRSFESLVGNKRIKSSDKLALLERYVTGEAAECIDGMFYRNDDDAYEDAWQMLNERYGHPSVILNAFRTKLSAWPKIASREYAALRKFADFLVAIDSASSHLPGLKNLSDEEENKKLLLKLPDWIITKWGSTVSDHDSKGLGYPSFHQFVDFLTQQAKIATRPVCSLYALKGERIEKRSPYQNERVERKSTYQSERTERKFPYQTNRQATTFLTDAELSTNTEIKGANVKVSSTKSQNSESEQTKGKNCAFCKASSHYLPNCFKFTKLTLDEKRQFIKEQKRCYRCLRTGHGAKQCKTPHKCQTCKGKHPSCLHDDNFKPSSSAINKAELGAATTYKVSCNAPTVSSSVTLPVWLSSKHNPTNEKLVYALIDSQSDTTFVDQSVATQLDSPFRETTRLKIGTITASNQSEVICERITDLQVRGYNNMTFVDLPPSYTVDHIPLQQSSIPTCDTARNWTHLQAMAEELPPLLDCEPGILIGFNCSHAFLPRECITGNDLEPFAVKTDLGWGIIGQASPLKPDQTRACHRIVTREVPLACPSDIIRVLERDFQDGPDKKMASQEDLQFLQTLERGIKKIDGRYELPLPFRNLPYLPNSLNTARKRLDHLKRKLTRDKELHSEYIKFMNSTLADGHAEKVEEADKVDGQVWYIPHHGVMHPQKRKLRVVFDCSARSHSNCLNDHLLTGPNLISSLVGVLCRFRQYNIAISCDIEKMFHQFRVAPEHRDFLRFLWWEEGDLTKEPSIFRMKVHLFGASSSPGCANYALKHLARDCKETFPTGSTFIKENFYVDDGLTSAPNVETAIKTINEAVQVCASGGLRLHKFASNSKDVMNNIPKTEQVASSQPLTLNVEDTAIQRTLGIQWATEDDSIHFSFSPVSKPATRRGIFSTVASLYDPLGLVAPFILSGKQILQATCHKGSKWDEEMPPELLSQWRRWEQQLGLLRQFSVPRCYYPFNFDPVEFQLHHFCDASLKGYGMCTYLRSKNANGDIHCSLVAAKSRVAPSKVMSIPRLELTSALVAAEIGSSVKESLTLRITDELFWSDSMVALGYINNDAKKFHIFVANRVQRIRELTKPSQWHHVSSEQNPADYCSRGLQASELLQSRWLTGPNFLWEKEIELPARPSPTLKLGDPEVKVVTSLKTAASPMCDLDSRLSHFSNWSCLLRAIAKIQKLRKGKAASRSQPHQEMNNSVKDCLKAELAIIRGVQEQYFKTEISAIRNQKPLPTSSSIKHAEPILKDGILRVGGRLTNDASLALHERHPIILPRDAHATKLLIQHQHEKAKHQGRGMTMNELRANGYWVVGGSRQVASLIKTCVTCRKLRGSVQEQQMADLPKERIEPSAPFTYVGMDVFGPFFVKNGRREIKRYGLIFTCFCSRAIHVEMIDDLTTDAFINGLRCFIAIRGSVTEIHSDQGTNFVGADNELRAALQEMDKNRIEEYLSQNQCQFIFNAPHASHTGGVWERQIRTVRAVLNATLSLSPNRLDDASLRTMFYEVMAIVNARPLTAVMQGEPTAPAPLTPNHILTMKPRTPLPPPGSFTKEDVYLRKRWRRVQFLMEQFWSRWKKEYLATLTLRQKWQKPRRNLKVGDIVLITESNTPRNQWSLARVMSVLQGKDGLVRSVKLHVATRELTNKGKRTTKPTVLERPVQQLVLLLALEEQ